MSENPDRANDFKSKIRGDEINPNTKADAPTESLTKYRAEKMNTLLDSVGKGFCMAKWYNVSMHLTHGWTHSCYHPTAHKIPLDELAEDPSALHNTKFKKEQRAAMLNGERPKECQYCWAIEDGKEGHMSDRPYRSQEVFTYTNYSKAVEEDPLKTNFDPTYVEVNFNHACNFKCSYCSPHLSSTWMEEIEDYGPYQMAGKDHNDIRWMLDSDRMPLKGSHNPYQEAFWKWWPDMYKKLRNFRMTGGEPLIDKNTFKVLDYVIENPKPNLQVSVTTNLNPPDTLWEKFLKQVIQIAKTAALEHFMVYVSVDGHGKQAEYMRYPLNFEQLETNVNRFLGEVPGYHSLTFINTFNALSVTSLKRWLEWILELRKKHSKTRQLIWFDIPYLHDPHWQTLKVLPESYEKYLEESIKFMQDNRETKETRFQGFKDYEVDKLQRDLEWMRKRPAKAELEQDRINFYRFFTEHDKRRSTNFLSAFPEMEGFWNECKALSDSFVDEVKEDIELDELSIIDDILAGRDVG
jgi:hypothetical protein